MSNQSIVIHGQTGLGTAGLIFSVLGWVTCGVLSPIGAVLSFLGLFGRGAKGHAIAGLIVGFPGVLFLVFVGGGIIAGILGIGAAASMPPAAPQSQSATLVVEPEPEAVVEPEPMPELKTPAVVEVQPEQEPEPEPVYREFSDASGQFRVEATVVASTPNAVKLQRRDTGKTVTIPIEKLSEADQKWLRENR